VEQQRGQCIELDAVQQQQQQQQQESINSSNEPEPALDNSTQVFHSKD